MSKTLRITIGGYGGEYTVGNISKEKAEFWLQKDEDELYEHITNPEDSDEENYIGYWHDNDNVIHSYGASEENLRIRIKFGNNEEKLYESLNDFENIFEMDDVSFEDMPEDEAYLICFAGEKGVFWEGTIEIDDDAEFNLNDITIYKNEIFGDRKSVV